MVEKGPKNYETGLCIMPDGGRTMSFKPSVKACSLKGCKELVLERYEGHDRRVCQHTGRIPGNMAKCPMEAEQ